MTPLLPCLDCGIPNKHTRCVQCQAVVDSLNPRQRLGSNQRGYNYAWRKVRLQILDRDGWRCTYCSKEISGADATVDHIVALDKGGSSTPGNLTSACRSCNSKKKNK